jgi:hypothetical protein
MDEACSPVRTKTSFHCLDHHFNVWTFLHVRLGTPRSRSVEEIRTSGLLTVTFGILSTLPNYILGIILTTILVIMLLWGPGSADNAIEYVVRTYAVKEMYLSNSIEICSSVQRAKSRSGSQT